MCKKNTKKSLTEITLIALFAALCYIALTVFFFPVGPMFVHFGNLIVVLAALLIGGWQGGISGSIGMGLYDILNGHADSSPKTFVLKLLIGITVGLVFNVLNRLSGKKTLNAVIAAVCGMVVNLAGETLWKTVQYALAGAEIRAAFVTSLLSQGSTLLNAVIAVIGGVALFRLLEKPIKKIMKTV